MPKKSESAASDTAADKSSHSSATAADEGSAVDVQVSGADEYAPRKLTVPGIRVVSRVPGFRRGGRAWPASPIDVALSEFTDEQLEQLAQEPNLVIIGIEMGASSE